MSKIRSKMNEPAPTDIGSPPKRPHENESEPEHLSVKKLRTISDGLEDENNSSNKKNSTEAKEATATSANDGHDICVGDEKNDGDTASKSVLKIIDDGTALKKNRDTKTISPVVSVDIDDEIAISATKLGSQKKSSADASDVLVGSDEVEAGDNCVRPHALTSTHSDILSSFMSIPFDAGAMASFHESKEGKEIDNSEKDTTVKHFPVKPQKAYMSSKKESDARAQQHSYENAKVSEFLLEEAKKMTQTPLPPTTTTVQHRPAPQAQFNSHQSLSIEKSPHILSNPNPSMFNINVSALIHQQQQQQRQMQQHQIQQDEILHQHLIQDEIRKQRLQQEIFHQQQLQQQQMQQMAFAAQHTIAFNNFQTYGALAPTNFHPYTNLPAANNAGMFHTAIHPQMHNLNLTQQGHPGVIQHARLPSNVQNSGIANSCSKKNSSNSDQPQKNKLQTSTKIAIASKIIKVTKDNIESISKLPVAFGFSLDDDGASKVLAVASAKKWTKEGQKAANLKEPKEKNKTPKKRNSMCGSPSSASGSSNDGRTPAKLLSTELIVRGLPEGWIKRTFQRNTGQSKGHTDKYFYSPQTQIKFRAMKNVRMFIDVLKEPGIDSNESAALRVFKSRGHKF